MKFPKLEEAQGRLNALRDELAGVFAEAGPDYDPSKVTSVQFRDGTEFYEYVAAKNAEIVDVKAEVERFKEVERAAQFAGETPEAVEVGAPAANGKRQSLGEAIVNSAAFQGYRGGGVGPTAHVDFDVRAELFETGDGWEPESTRTGIVTLTPQRRAPRVVQYFNSIPTTQTAVKYMEETVFTNNAAETSEGGAYGEARLKLVQKSVDVEKVTVWLPMTDEQLEDVPGAQAYIDSRLRLMLAQRVDKQALQGNGTAPNLLGTENVTGIQTQAKGSDPTPDALYKLFTKIRDDHDNSGGDAEPNVVFMRATKWEKVALLRTSDGVYIWGHPSQGGPQQIWGVPVELTNAVTATKAVSGDYMTHAHVAPRRGIDVQITNAHNDYFTSGKLAVRADVRLAVVHIRPAAFGEVTGL